MKIRLCKFWLHFCFFTSKCSQYTETQSCNSGASGKRVRPHCSRSGVPLSYGKAASLWQHPCTAQRREGGRQALLAIEAQVTLSTRVAKQPGSVRAAITVIQILLGALLTLPSPAPRKRNSWDLPLGARDNPALALLESL